MLPLARTVVNQHATRSTEQFHGLLGIDHHTQMERETDPHHAKLVALTRRNAVAEEDVLGFHFAVHAGERLGFTRTIQSRSLPNGCLGLL